MSVHGSKVSAIFCHWGTHLQYYMPVAWPDERDASGVNVTYMHAGRARMPARAQSNMDKDWRFVPHEP